MQASSNAWPIAAAVDQISVLFWSAVVNGVIFVPIIVALMQVASNRR